MRPLIPALLLALASNPALAQEPLREPVGQAPCVSPDNPLGFLFGGCLTGEETYKIEEAETLRRIESGTATSFDYANYRLLQFLNSPGEDVDN